MNKLAIRDFIKRTLGCNCPDKVFKDIRYQANATVPQCRSSISRIELGDRLLVYLLVTDNPDIVERDLSIIVGNGKTECDASGFNRFRAVVCTTNIGAVAHLADSVFTRQIEKDDKVHLHVVAREDVQAIFEPTRRY